MLLPLTQFQREGFSTKKPIPTEIVPEITEKAKATRKEIRIKLMAHMTDPTTKRLFYNSMFLVFASKSLAIASPWFLKAVVDSMALGTNLSLTTAFYGIGAFGAARFASTMLGEWRMFQINKIIQTGTKRISFNAFTHLHNLDIDFHKTSSKNTVFAINRALRSIESALRFTLGFFTPVALEFILLCIMLQFYCGPKYLFNMLVTLSLYTYFSKTFSEVRRVQMADKKNAEKASEFYLNESIMNYEAVKSFNNEELEKSRYKGHLDKLLDNAMVVQLSLSQLNAGQTVIFTSGMIFNLMMAANDVSLGLMTAGDFILIQAYFMQLSGPLFNMGTLFREVGQTQVDVEDLMTMLERVPKIQDSPTAVDFKYQSGNIEFQNVSFGHKKESVEASQFLFQGLNLTFKAGTTNAIVGPSGFGKTSMLHLMFRIYDPEVGCVKIDGQDLKDVKLDSFRRLISVIPQNGILFNDTIGFNLKYGNPDATQEEIERVAKICKIHDKIMSMQAGYDSPVGDLGAKLSGGERQRILIARGLLKKEAKIFLFDEATSSLDSKTEKEITEELDKIMKTKTVIYCAHRLSSIINVDQIHVVSHGKVVEQGTHTELMANGPVYQQMWHNYLRDKKEIVATPA